MIIAEMDEAHGFYLVLKANAKSSKRIKSLESLWSALCEMVEKKIPMKGVPDIARFIKENLGGSPALSTITNDTDGMNKLVQIVVGIAQSAENVKPEKSGKRNAREQIYDALISQMKSEKNRGFLELLFRENTQLEKENKILRGAYAELTQGDIIRSAANSSKEIEIESSKEVRQPMYHADLIDQRAIQGLFDILSEQFNIVLDPSTGDLMSPEVGYLGAKDAVKVLSKLLS